MRSSFLQHLVIVWVERRPFEVLSGSAVTAWLHTTRRIIYPDGVNCRIKEWLFSVDHCRASPDPSQPPPPAAASFAPAHRRPFLHSHGNVRAHTHPVQAQKHERALCAATDKLLECEPIASPMVRTRCVRDVCTCLTWRGAFKRLLESNIT